MFLVPMSRTENSYAIYVRCDAAMNYDSKNTGGIGYVIEFPEDCAIDNIFRKVGHYVGANIERLELNALILGMTELLKVYKYRSEDLKAATGIICITDRFSLNDQEKTSPYRIREYRRNKWRNHEGKEIKNSDLLDRVDKLRAKIYRETHLVPRIEYRRRKENKAADVLSKQAKLEPIVNKGLAKPGLKVGTRKFDGGEVDYQLLESNQNLTVHIFKKERIKSQWEISAEICDGKQLGQKVKIYTDSEIEKELHRRHTYKVLLKQVYMHHVSIEEGIAEVIETSN